MNKSRFIISAIAFICSITLFSTNTKLKTNQVGISTFKREKDSVQVAFWIKQMKRINTLRELIIQPVISNGNDSLILSTYAIRGRYNNNLHKRDNVFTATNNKSNISQSVIISKNQKNGSILFIDTVITYQPWMKHADLNLRADLCGCGAEQSIIYDSKNLDYYPSLMEIHPFLVFSLSRTDESIIKNRKKYTLYFRVNESIIDTNYMGNAETLNQLKNDIKGFSQNLLNITNVLITGYASPEGPLSGNKKLAESRSFAFAEISRILSSEKIFSNPELDITDEDWEGLNFGLESDTSALAQKTLNILRNKKQRREQKTELKYSQNGKVYDFIKRNYLNRLRKSDLIIEYELNTEMIKQSGLIPKEISQYVTYNSLFNYAININDSARSAQIIYNAAEAYKHNQRAILNAGIMALKERNYEKAERYLKHLDRNDNSSELDNALGVLAMYTGKYEEAIFYFQKAKEKGLSEVETNISILNSLN